LHQYSPNGIDHYGFSEIPKHFTHENTVTIPAGTYFFRQDETSQIDNVREIFREQLADKDSFLAIETEELFFSKTKISQPIYELRIVVL